MSGNQLAIGWGWECSGEGEVLLKGLGAGRSLEDSEDTEQASMLKAF